MEERQVRYVLILESLEALLKNESILTEIHLYTNQHLVCSAYKLCNNLSRLFFSYTMADLHQVLVLPTLMALASMSNRQPSFPVLSFIVLQIFSLSLNACTIVCSR